MKKIHLLLMLLMLFTALVFSCGEDETTDPVGSYTTATESYQLENDAGERRILCPTIDGTASDESLNAALQAEALANAERYLLYQTPTGYYRYTIDSVSAGYTSDNLASFLCIGSYADEGSTYPDTIVYTININPQTGAVYTFEDLIADFDVLAEQFTAGKFSLVSGADDLLDATNWQDMFVEYSALYQIYPPLYFIKSDEDVKLALSVGLVYTLGGHAEFAIPTDSVKSAMTDTLVTLLY